MQLYLLNLFKRHCSLYNLVFHSYQSLSVQLSPDGEEQEKYFSLKETNFCKASKFKSKSAKLNPKLYSSQVHQPVMIQRAGYRQSVSATHPQTFQAGSLKQTILFPLFSGQLNTFQYSICKNQDERLFLYIFTSNCFCG